MRRFFFRKQVEIGQGFENFIGCIQRSIDLFSAAMLDYLEHGGSESFDRSCHLIDRAESEADDLRLKIERNLYKNELLPDSRGDLLSLLEWCDKIPNRVEAVVNNILLRKIEIPVELKPCIKELLEPIQSSVETLLVAVRLLLKEPSKTKAVVDDVDRLESECDELEYRTIRNIYNLDIDLAHKIQLERLLTDIGSIADRCEDAAHRLEIIAIKRTL